MRINLARNPRPWVGTMLFGAALLQPCAAQPYSNAQLLEEATLAWEKLQCVRAARFLFAYQLRNPPALANSEHNKAVQTVIDWCESNTHVAAGGKGDDPAEQAAAKKKPKVSLRP